MPPRRTRSSQNITNVEDVTPDVEVDEVGDGQVSPQYDLAERSRPEAAPEHDSNRRSESRSSLPVVGQDVTYETRSSSPVRPRSQSHSRSRSQSYARSPSPPPPAQKPQRPTKLHYKPRLVLHGHKRGVASVRFSPDGKWIASASADCTLKIWDAHTGKLQHTLEGHLAGISALAWSPDSTLIASGSDDKSIRLWDAMSGKAHPIPFSGHHNYIYSLAFSPKGNMIVSGSYDEAVYIWDVRAARVMKSLPAHSDPVSGVDFVCDGTLIASCGEDGLIRVWDTATGQCLRTLVHEDRAPVMAVRFAPNGKYVLAWTADSCIRLWDYVDGRAVKTYQGHVNQKYSISGEFGTYGADAHKPQEEGIKDNAKAEWAFIASGSEDGSVVLWDVGSKDVLQHLKGHTAPVLGVDTHPTERLLVSCSLDKTIRVWVCDEDGEEHADDEGLPASGAGTPGDFAAQLTQAAQAGE